MTPRKPKVKYSAVLTRRRKLHIMYVWAMIRIDPEFSQTAQYKSVLRMAEKVHPDTLARFCDTLKKVTA